MCKRPWGDRPAAGDTVAHDHGEASPHQESTVALCLNEGDTNMKY